MKVLIATLTLNFLATVGHADQDTTPTLVRASLTKVYVPDGFDDNDNVQIVGEGLFSNTCYRYASTTVNINRQNKVIELTPTAYKYNGICLMVVLPFQTEVELGILAAGTYSIVQTDVRAELGRITIHRSPLPEADEFMYAPMSQAFFKSSQQGGRVLLNGNFPLSCMKMKEARTHAQSDVFVIQPIVELQEDVDCVEGQYAFEASVSTTGLTKGRYLLHVRAMNGKSVNSLIDVP